MSSSSAALSTPEGPGSVSGAEPSRGVHRHVPSRYIDTGELRQHAGDRRRGAAAAAGARLAGELVRLAFLLPALAKEAS
jgi:hypothetical protein